MGMGTRIYRDGNETKKWYRCMVEKLFP